MRNGGRKVYASANFKTVSLVGCWVCGKASRQLGTMHANLASGSGRATGTACDGGKIGAVCVAFLLKRRRTTTRNTALGATRHHVQRSVSVTRFLHTTLCNRHGGVQRRTGVRKQKAIVCVIFKLNDQKAYQGAKTVRTVATQQPFNYAASGQKYTPVTEAYKRRDNITMPTR